MGTRVLVVVLACLFCTSGWAALDPLRDLTKAGVNLYSASDFEGALREFSRAQEYAPESGLLYFNLGTTQYRRGDYERAQEALERAIRTSDDVGLVQRAWFNLGNTHYQAGLGPAGVPSSTEELAHWEESIKAYEKALDLDPEDQDAKFNLELVRRRLKQLLDMQRPSAESERLKQQADELVDQRRYREALELMQQVLANDPGAQAAYQDYTTRLQDVVEIVDGGAAPAEEPS